VRGKSGVKWSGGGAVWSSIMTSGGADEDEVISSSGTIFLIICSPDLAFKPGTHIRD